MIAQPSRAEPLPERMRMISVSGMGTEPMAAESSSNSTIAMAMLKNHMRRRDALADACALGVVGAPSTTSSVAGVEI